jgi:putative ABC transport system permease protein
MNQFLQDLRFSARLLLKTPGFTLLVVIVLALGCGANTAIFSILNAVVLRPLPYAEPSRLYEIAGATLKETRRFSAPDLASWRERTRIFEKMVAVRPSGLFLSNIQEPEQLFGLAVDRECMSMLGTPALMGRWFLADDFGPAAPKTVLIGQRLWHRSFGGDVKTLGKSITLNGESYLVIGVMPAEFQFYDRRLEFWIPLQFTPQQLNGRDQAAFQVYARAKAGIKLKQVQAEADLISRLLTEQFPAMHKNWRATATPFQEKVVGDSRPTLFLLFGAVGFVLLIACLNVANLLLARGTDRAKEVAIRTALGASRFRIVRQMLTESLLLAFMASVLGLLLAGWANKGIIALFTQKSALPRMEQTSVDGWVLCFTFTVALVSTLLFGLMPALQASKIDLHETLKEAGRSGMMGVRSRRLRNFLIVAETGLSMVLLVGAGLMLRSFSHLLQVNPGFKADRVFTARLPIPQYRVNNPNQHPMYYQEILRRIQSLPGIHSAGLVTVLPLSGGEATLTILSHNDNGEEEERIYPFRAVSADYFKTMGIPIVMGRAFSDSDNADAAGVVIASEMLARQRWPGENPIGKSLRLMRPVSVVGVVGNIRHTRLSAPPQAELYLPYLQYLGTPNSNLVIRAETDPLALAPAIRKSIRDAQPDQPIVDVRTMEDVVYDSIAQPRFYTLLLGIFATLALFLAVAGIYGVISYTVSQCRHEIGIRMALGAQSRHILMKFMLQGAWYVFIGIALGLAGAFATTRFISTMLFEVTQTDPETYLVVSLLLVAFALLGIYFPARRALKADPLSALRDE